jgi:hypothetical protein
MYFLFSTPTNTAWLHSLHWGHRKKSEKWCRWRLPEASPILPTVAFPSSFINRKSTTPKSLILVNVTTWLHYQQNGRIAGANYWEGCWRGHHNTQRICTAGRGVVGGGEGKPAVLLPRAAESKRWQSEYLELKKNRISGPHRDVDEMYALLGYYAASSGNPLPTFRDNLSVPSTRVRKSEKYRKGFLDFLMLENRSDRLYRNVGTELSLNTV